jgi:hypothetical protein
MGGSTYHCKVIGDKGSSYINTLKNRNPYRLRLIICKWRQRAERRRGYVRSALPAIYPTIWFGPNRQRRAKAGQFLDELVKKFGSLSLKKRLECLGTLPLSFWTWITARLGLSQQPSLFRREHRV